MCGGEDIAEGDASDTPQNYSTQRCLYVCIARVYVCVSVCVCVRVCVYVCIHMGDNKKNEGKNERGDHPRFLAIILHFL